MSIGEISIQVATEKNGTKSYVKKQYFKLPIQIMPPFYQDEDGTVSLYLLNPSGGMVSGDEFYINVSLSDNSRLMLATPSSNKVYKRKDSFKSVQKNLFSLGKDACLEYYPESVIPFKDSYYEQDTVIELEESSKLIMWDIFSPGRVSRNEAFSFYIYKSDTKIYLDDRLIYRDNAVVENKEQYFSSMICMENNLFMATVIGYSCDVEKNSIKEQFGKSVDGTISAITSPSKGLIVGKVLAQHMYLLEEECYRIANLLRNQILGKNRLLIRKY
ncbi:MAG: urease accessory protein UreD [Butyrivibrio sp.]|nr:urease accessory protein UreD [Butyrivibrio sp.]MCR5391100.1 urease accessory protein UreD [Lachnospiraceae bacterium]